jgi:hypothetical protein
MATIKAARDAGPDPKLGRPKSRSSVEFPYYDIESSSEVALVIHEREGGECDRPTLAAYLNYSSATNGSFLTRVAAARMYGLIETAAGKLRVTDRGRAIARPITPSGKLLALVEAFMAVELFSKVYEQFKGTVVPETAGLRNLLESKYGVVKARVAPTVRILMASAEQAGFFKAAGNRRMVMPNVTHAEPVSGGPPPAVHQDDRPDPARTGGGDGGGNGDIPAAFIALLGELPPRGSQLDEETRGAVKAAFENILTILYPKAKSIG